MSRRGLSLALLAAGFGLVLSHAAFADVYEWTDENGVVHYSDSDEQIPEGTPAEVELEEPEYPSQDTTDSADGENPEAAEPQSPSNTDGEETASDETGNREGVEEDSEDENQEPREIKRHRVVMYATEWCPYCEKTRAFFRKHGISYTEKDIEKDPLALRELDAKAGPKAGVPVLVIDDRQIIRGYDEKALELIFLST